MRFSDMRELQTSAKMAGLEREFLELLRDAQRWKWVRANPITLDDFTYYIDYDVEEFVDAHIASESAVGYD